LPEGEKVKTQYNCYAHHNHGNWLRKNLHINPSPLGATVANILGYVGGGLYNSPIDLKKVEWTNTFIVSVIWKNNHLTNWDDFALSRLWVRCHREMIRVEISVGEYEEIPEDMDDDEYAEPVKHVGLLLQFWQREKREGNVMGRLPDCEEMIRDIDDDFKDVNNC
jgi:hypothetical protein